MGKFDLKLFIRRKILKNKVTSDELLERLRQGGAQIGQDVMLYSTGKTLIDSCAPFLLKIGDHVRICEGVKILNHDYAWSVLKGYSSEKILPGNILGAWSPVEIGSNVFIGMNAIITRGVKIGDNVVIGAGSVVTKDCPSNGIYAGNPAKRIMSIEEFYRKREAMQFAEAKEVALSYKAAFGKEPPVEIFTEYFLLFCTREDAERVPAFRKLMARMENLEDTIRYMQTHKPQFSGYAEFLKTCYREETSEDAV